MVRKDGKDRGLFQRAGKPEWWIRWTCPYGHGHQEKIGPKSLARQFYAQRKVAVKTQGFCLTQAKEAKRKAQPVLFRDVARRYLEWSQENRPRSYAFRKTALGHLVAAFDTTALTDITRTHVEAYIRHRCQEAVRPETINRERAVLSHLFSRAQAWGLADTNPVTGTDRLDEVNERLRPLSQEEEARLLTAVRAQLWRDVDLASSILRVTQPKSKKPEVIPLNSTAFAVLAALPQEELQLFPSMPSKLSDLFIRYACKTELTDVTFHCLRDTSPFKVSQNLLFAL